MELVEQKIATAFPKIKRVAIYCRVSSSRQDQMRSLGSQISKLIERVIANRNQKLYDIYVDVCSGYRKQERRNLDRLLVDAKAGKVDIVIVKAVSRFYRDTEFLLRTVRQLRRLGVEVVFNNENISSMDDDAELMLAITGAIAQAESDGKSSNIRWGINKAKENPDSKMNNRVFYGYKHDTDGRLIVDEEQAKVVNRIYDLYIEGYSVLKIIGKLYEEGIPSPRGNDKWSKHSIEVILQDERYTGMQKCPGYQMTKIIKEHHAAIMPYSKFEKVVNLRAERSNLIHEKDGSVTRKNTRYKSHIE